MKENSIEKTLENIQNVDLITLLRQFKKEGVQNFIVLRRNNFDKILSDYKRVLKENKTLNKKIDLMENYMVENGGEICFDNIYSELNNCNGMERDWCRGDKLEKEDIHRYFNKKILESEEL